MDYRCLICNAKPKSMNKYIDWFQCNKCHYYIKLDRITQELLSWDITQIIDGVSYRAYSHYAKEYIQLLISNDMRLQAPYIQVSNQKELETILPRLLKMKAFL